MSNVIQFPQAVQAPADLPLETVNAIKVLVAHVSKETGLEPKAVSSVISKSMETISEIVLADLVRLSSEGVSLFSIMDRSSEKIRRICDGR